MKFILSASLVLLTLFSCYVEDAYFQLFPPQPGKAAVFTSRAQLPFDFDQEKAFGSKRNLAVSQYIPLYSFLPDRVETTKKKMQDLMRKIPDLLAEQRADGSGLAKYLRKEIGIEMSQQAAAQLLNYPNINNLLAAVAAIEETVLQSRIVEDAKPIKGKKTAEVLYPDPVGTIAFPAGEFITLDEARENLKRKILQVFWQVDKSVLDPVIDISLAMLMPNLRYDQKENDRRIEEIIRRYPSKLVPYEEGDVLVPFRKVMTEEDVLLIAAHQEVENKGLFESVLRIFFAVVFAVTIYVLLVTKVLQPWLHRKTSAQVFLLALIVSVLFFKTYLLFTALPIYGIPFCLLPILLVLLERERISATWTVLLGAMIVSLFAGRTAEILLFFLFGGLMVVLLAPRIRKRVDVLIPALWAALYNAVFATIFLIDWKLPGPWPGTLQAAIQAPTGGPFNPALLVEVGWAFLGGIASGPAALVILPIIEFLSQRASAFKLTRYADLQHPLMRDLLTKAPGTYQHTMSVAYLAEAAGDAIGANTLLLRTGAYYHDIGKMANPKFFVENQFGGNNTHSDLDPAESARIIIDHVTTGIRMGTKAGLPGAVVDFIPQHHGTRLVEYFYDKACKRENPTAKPDKQDFQYPGPKPQSVETALIMIVDAVEAASRTIQDPTREKIENLIRFIIEKRMAEGQFDECSLSTREIAMIIQVLTDSIDASFHVRVQYPWQEEERASEKVALSSGDNQQPKPA